MIKSRKVRWAGQVAGVGEMMGVQEFICDKDGIELADDCTFFYGGTNREDKDIKINSTFQLGTLKGRRLFGNLGIVGKQILKRILQEC